MSHCQETLNPPVPPDVNNSIDSDMEIGPEHPKGEKISFKDMSITPFPQTEAQGSSQDTIGDVDMHLDNHSSIKNKGKDHTDNEFMETECYRGDFFHFHHCRQSHYTAQLSLAHTLSRLGT
ncbi:hypothetical protein HAX54_042071 [Datura stramonium]|uniref:Uncharacterized protein n=1 Tax=Datura stramonium TaxID=4076 RepID=A0ABS8VYG7_DATST|nr:hypothetical protein [Datura stramonium]